MAVLKGCQEGKATPKLVEIVCPKCKEVMEVFVRMGGGISESGTVVSDETCPKCGYVATEGTPISEFEKA